MATTCIFVLVGNQITDAAGFALTLMMVHFPLILFAECVNTLQSKYFHKGTKHTYHKLRIIVLWTVVSFRTFYGETYSVNSLT